MNNPHRHERDQHFQPNPILVAFFQEARRLSEEANRREEAAASSLQLNTVFTEEDL